MDRFAIALGLLVFLPGCLPLLAPHGEVRGNIGLAAGTLRAGTAGAVRLAGNVDAVYLPTQLLGCDRELDIGVGARFHFVEPDAPGVRPERVGGVLSGSWLFFREPGARGELRFDADVLALEDRPLAGLSVSLGIEVIGFAEGSGAWGGWEGLFAGIWSGEAALRIEAQAGYHEDFGGVRYATFTLGLAARWPAGAGAAIINPVFLADIAFRASGSTSSTTTGLEPEPEPRAPLRPSPSAVATRSEGDVRGCPEVTIEPAAEVTVSEDGELSLEPAPRHRCVLRDGTVAYLPEVSEERAEEVCSERFEMPCACVLSPE